MNQVINEFVRHARQKGLDHAIIRHLLLAAGWKDKEIAQAIVSEGLDIPVPEPRGSGNARDSFIYLLSFAALYVAVGCVISIYFVYLDYLFPDPSDFAEIDWVLAGVRYCLAAIVIAFPLFAILARVLERIVRQSPEAAKQHVARWLTYLTMFLAAAVVAGDLITLLFFFLDGSLSSRFVLKAAVLLVIAQLVLSYFYLAPRDAPAGGGRSLRRWLGGAGTAIILGAVVLGFALAGSPFTARLRRMDERRLADLKLIRETIQEMTTRRDYNFSTWVPTRPLPTSLDEVAEYRKTRQYGRALTVVDPTSGAQYSYRVTGDTKYELCAEFDLERDLRRELFWNHPAGKHCFAFDTLSPP